MENNKDKNYLDFIPKKNPLFNSEIGENELIILSIENKGFFNTLAQRLFKRPKFSYIHLDEYGSYIWQNIDGERSIADIAVLQREKFGEAVEPLYPRIAEYFRMLQGNGLVEY